MINETKFHTLRVVSLGFIGGLLVALMVYHGLGWVLALIIAALLVGALK